GAVGGVVRDRLCGSLAGLCLCAATGARGFHLGQRPVAGADPGGDADPRGLRLALLGGSGIGEGTSLVCDQGGSRDLPVQRRVHPRRGGAGGGVAPMPVTALAATMAALGLYTVSPLVLAHSPLAGSGEERMAALLSGTLLTLFWLLYTLGSLRV